ncbi:hypothetical protein [Polaromonas sp. UC242_47]|uniref:hypothetical protein n=1 Tax=Polaromonas sp. UC242_47 TaxID=3374626 RepID=UPI00379AEC03
MKTWVKWCIAIAVIACLAAIGRAEVALYEHGKKVGKQECEEAHTKSDKKQQSKANAKTKGDLKRADASGNAQEKGRAAVDQFFEQLTKDSSHEAADSVDSCVLPDARLRRWNSANAGRVDTADQGGAARELDTGTGPAATGGNGQGARSGGESPSGGQGVPPARNADVQSAGLSGGQS